MASPEGPPSGPITGLKDGAELRRVPRVPVSRGEETTLRAHWLQTCLGYRGSRTKVPKMPTSSAQDLSLYLVEETLKMRLN